MRSTFAQFRDYLRNSGLELTVDDEFNDVGMQYFVPPDGHIILVNGQKIENGIEVFGDDCNKDIYQPNTVRCIFNVDNEDLLVLRNNQPANWELYKRVIR